MHQRYIPHYRRRREIQTSGFMEKTSGLCGDARVNVGEVQLAGDHEADPADGTEPAVSAILGLGRLEELMEGLQELVGLARGVPGEDAFEMSADHVGDFFRRLDLRAHDGAAPVVEQEACTLWLLAGSDLPQVLSVLLGACGAGGGHLGEQSSELMALCGGECGAILQQHPALALEVRVEFVLDAAHLVDGLGGMDDDVEFVEGDRGIGQMLADSADEGRGDVDTDSLRVGAHERLVLQIFLQRFEKQLHHQTVLVDRGDGRGGKPEIVGQELKFPLLLLAIRGHQPKLKGALLLRLGAAKANHRVLLHVVIGLARDRLILHDSVHAVVLQARDEMHPLIRPATKQLIVVLALVIRDDRPGRQFRGLRHRHVMNLASRDHRKTRQASVVIEQQMHPDCSLGSAKLRPVVHRNAQIDHRGAQAHRLVLDPKLLHLSSLGRRQLRLTAPVEQMKHIAVKLRGPMRVHVRERGSVHHLDAQVRRRPLTTAQSLLGRRQTVRSSHLAEQHQQELVPVAHTPCMPLGAEPAYLALEVRPRNKLEDLPEQPAKSVHAEPLRCLPKRLGNCSSLHGKTQHLSRQFGRQCIQVLLEQA